MKPSRIFIIISLLLAMVATSCKIGQRYARPDVELPSRLDGTVIADTVSIGDLPWNQVYADTL